MHALVLREIGKALEFLDRAELMPGDGQAVVRLRAAALNRRDYWITQGMYPGIQMPVVLGSDGAGVVTKLGAHVDPQWQGREVIINPGLDWGDDEAAQSAAFRILGMPDDGTFAEEVLAPASALHSKPGHLNWHEAAALPLAGVTSWRAMFTQGQLLAGQRVLITGIGGGVATMALQFAVAAGAEVLVTSSSQEKIERACVLGARAGFLYTADDWPRQLKSRHGAMALIVDGAGGDGYARLIDVAAPGGRIVNYGSTAGPPGKLDLFKVFWKQLRLIGSTMGSPRDFAAMLEFVNRHAIKPVVDAVLPLAEGNAAIARMQSSPQFGKLVLEM